MKPASIPKYLFKIRTRNGVVVDNLMIYGRDEDEAMRKLRQMYNDCEVLDSQLQAASPAAGRHGTLNYEDVVELISTS